LAVRAVAVPPSSVQHLQGEYDAGSRYLEFHMSSFALYIVGMVIVIGGLAWGASMAGLATQWIAMGAIVLLGIGIVTAVSRTRQKDPPA